MWTVRHFKYDAAKEQDGVIIERVQEIAGKRKGKTCMDYHKPENIKNWRKIK